MKNTYKKSKGGIWFNSEIHQYTNDDGEVYRSGTAFVSLFKPKYDSDFWSTLKCYEPYFNEVVLNDARLAEYTEWFNKIGRKVREAPTYWEYIKKYFFVYSDDSDVKQKTLHLANSISEELSIKFDLEKAKKEMLAKWRNNSKEATDKGTLYHDKKESELKTYYNHPIDWSGYNLAYPFLRVGRYAELRLYNHKYKVAGSADKVSVNTKSGNFVLMDYKTSKEVSAFVYTNPWTGKSDNMLEPIDKLGNCNYVHYQLQLSLYAWMLEELGYTCKKLYIIHNPVDQNGNTIKYNNGRNKEEWIPVNYAKKAILMMLDYYEKNYLNN